ncbi:MAG: DUF5069 domain-containing protein [Leptospirillia bacterium]
MTLRLRSPRETLGGYVILPRLVDKVRAQARGELPEDYRPNLLRPVSPEMGFYPLDGRFLAFKELDPGELEAAILRAPDDEAVLAFVESHGRKRSETEKEEWRRSIEEAPADERRTAHRKRTYPTLAHRPDIGELSPFDLIDLDEGRPLP